MAVGANAPLVALPVEVVDMRGVCVGEAPPTIREVVESAPRVQGTVALAKEGPMPAVIEASLRMSIHRCTAPMVLEGFTRLTTRIEGPVASRKPMESFTPVEPQVIPKGEVNEAMLIARIRAPPILTFIARIVDAPVICRIFEVEFVEVGTLGLPVPIL